MIGIGASQGIAIGRAYVLNNSGVPIGVESINEGEVNTELERFERALEKAKFQLKGYRNKVEVEIGYSEARIFNAQLLMLEDPEFIGHIRQRIENNLESAAFAANRVLEGYINIFRNIDDIYLKERVIDIKDVGRIIINNLLNIPLQDLNSIEDDVIIVAHDLTPSETARMNKGRILGFCTEIGGTTSHTAIMARSLEIPAVLGIDGAASKIVDGDLLIIDGFSGRLHINPREELLTQYRERLKRLQHYKKELERLKGQEAVTLDGHRVKLYGNIGSPQEVDNVLKHGGQGAGLVRTEFLYMERESPPTEEEQYRTYKEIIVGMKGAPVTIRTLDIGGDKNLPYLEIPPEENPFLGYRGIRLSLNRQAILKTQLRGILRASIHGQVSIMYPMISTIQEIKQANDLLDKAKRELEQEGIPFDRHIKIGIMVETPSTAVTADIFASYVDFFSIGTNDLCQYTLAVDRTNSNVSYLYEHLNPAMIRLVKGIIEAAHQKGLITGMCGEMAADPYSTLILLGLGLDEFSMNPASIPQIKRIIRSFSKERARVIAERALELEDSVEIRTLVEKELEELHIFFEE